MQLDRRAFLASSTAMGLVTLAGCATTQRQSAAGRDQALSLQVAGDDSHKGPS